MTTTAAQAPVKKVAETAMELIDIVGLSFIDPTHQGPEVMHITLWDGRVVAATYTHDPYNVATPELNFPPMDRDTYIGPLVNQLIKSHIPFITSTGSHDAICTLEWTIEPAPAS